MTDYALVLTSKFPGRQWSLSGNDPATLVFHDDGPVITGDELDALWPKVEFDSAYAQVEQARHAAYISVADPLFFKWQRQTGTEQAWRDAVQAVKDAHPYPEPV